MHYWTGFWLVVPKEIIGRDGLLDTLTKRLMERALEGELTDHAS